MLNRVLILLPMALFLVFAAMQLQRNWMPDLFIYRTGALLGWQGHSPYSEAVRDAVKVQYAGDQRLIDNCGFFLPPQTIIVLGPFAALPWPAAMVLYTLLSLVCLFACWYGLLFAFRGRPAPAWDAAPFVLPLFICIHPLFTIGFAVGQTTILAVGAIIAGQILHERGNKWFAAGLWAVPFIKPHVALVLLPLAWYLDDWKRPLRIIVWLALLNLAGGLLAGGSPLFFLDYLHQISTQHKSVIFNLVSENPQITSWNSALLAVPGAPAIELSLPLTLAGYAVFGSMIVLRCALAKKMPGRSWAVAVAAVAAVVCCQVLAYEVFLLVLVVPLILDHWDAGRRNDVYLLGGLLLLQMIPLDPMIKLGFPRYRPVLVLALAAVLLFRPVWREDVPKLPSCQRSGG